MLCFSSADRCVGWVKRSAHPTRDAICIGVAASPALDPTYMLEPFRPSKLRRCARQEFPVRALLLPVHEYVEIGAALFAISDGLAFVCPVEAHDCGGANDTNLGVRVGQ